MVVIELLTIEKNDFEQRTGPCHGKRTIPYNRFW